MQLSILSSFEAFRLSQAALKPQTSPVAFFSIVSFHLMQMHLITQLLVKLQVFYMPDFVRRP
jgi:hypothetical protein